MPFDWIRFFTNNSIEFVDSGPNVAKGNVNIHCPFCGDADPSHHLGVSLSGDGWGCWRNVEHRGKSPVRLIKALIGCSTAVAAEIAGYDDKLMPADPMRAVSALLTRDQRQRDVYQSRRLCLPSEFREFRDTNSFAPYKRYLEKRGYSARLIFGVLKSLGLLYCTAGPFAGRIIFPVYESERLVSWTGRSVNKDAAIRYKSLSYKVEEGVGRNDPQALGPISDYLLWYDDLCRTGHDTIFLVEGPFDALKVRVLGNCFGVTSTCFFTQSPSMRQMDLLYELLPSFKHRFLLLDQNTTHVSMRITGELSSFGVRSLSLPYGVKDPGDLDDLGFERLLQNAC